MIIGVCGFGSTGSSAVSDYLSEFNDVQVIDRIEFTWVTQTDGLIDLEYHLFHPHGRTADSIKAIERYKDRCLLNKNYYCRNGGIDESLYLKSTKNFLDSITMIRWPWFTYKDLSFKERIRGKIATTIIPDIEKKQNKQYERYPHRWISFSVMPPNFYESARKHVMELLTGMGYEQDKDLVLDQPFSGDNPQAAFPFYCNPKAIVVDRDPRDLFCFARTKLLGRNHFMPVNDVKDFVIYYRCLRDNQPYKMNDDNVLGIRFEDLVYEYDRTTAIIREFLHYPDNPRPRSVFNPDLSIANTQVYRRFSQFSSEIKYIENELREYLYDFDKYEEPSNTEMFFGKSILNKNK